MLADGRCAPRRRPRAHRNREGDSRFADDDVVDAGARSGFSLEVRLKFNLKPPRQRRLPPVGLSEASDDLPDAPSALERAPTR
jgi:hypothetical protein